MNKLRTFNFMPLLSEKAKTRGSNHCLLCGRKLGKKHAWVRVVKGGGYVAHIDDYELISVMSDLGMFGIGSECKNKLPAEFVKE